MEPLSVIKENTSGLLYSTVLIIITRKRTQASNNKERGGGHRSRLRHRAGTNTEVQNHGWGGTKGLQLERWQLPRESNEAEGGLRETINGLRPLLQEG